jgi:phospholipid-translocating ATPase
MAAPSGHPDYGGSGMRRRQSTVHSEDDDTAPNAPTIGLDGQTGKASADSNDAPAAQSSSNTPSASVESSIPLSSPSLTVDAPPRVRFSSDVERQPPAASSASPALHERPPRSAGSTHSVLKNRPTTAELSLDTDNAAPKPTVLGGGLVRSPPPVTSPPTLTRRITSPTSPTSPTGRGRGYSLRSALFRRNISETAESPSTVIELQETAGASTEPPPGRPLSIETGKSDADTSITIAPAGDSRSSEASKSTKGLQGISALPHYESWILSRARRNGVVRAASAAYQRSRKIILRIQEIPPSKDGRHIDLDASRKKDLIDERTGKVYCGNTIRSTRFTPWNFLPRQLFAQFSKLANFYFLCVSILQMIPGLSTTGQYTTFAPLMFFVSISMAKEGIDDLRRHKLDKAENIRDAKVLHAYRPTKAGSPDTTATEAPEVAPIHWAPIKWRDVKVGDVVKLERNDAAPADLVLLRSSGPNGIAYVETMALDGETNLKSKQATSSISKACVTEENVAACRAHFVVEDPNLDLYNFEGKVTVDGKTSPLTNNEIIYRGSILRNTPDAIGMVIYSGEECKIRMNANKHPRIKAPSLQSIVNRIVIFIVIFVIALAIFNTVAYQIWDSNENKSWYLTNAGVAFFPILTSFIIMFNTMIPLSLYVSLEIIKLAQMYFFNDIDMYDPVSDTPCEARTSTINEELGQIRYDLRIVPMFTCANRF